MTAYEEYLKSYHWKIKRREAREFYHHSCVLCGSKQVQVHHRNYYNLWNEDCARDLILLCKECHKKFHENESEEPFILEIMFDKESVHEKESVYETEFSLTDYLFMELTEAWNEPDRSRLSC